MAVTLAGTLTLSAHLHLVSMCAFVSSHLATQLAYFQQVDHKFDAESGLSLCVGLIVCLAAGANSRIMAWNYKMI
jgi:hypothetical protein